MRPYLLNDLVLAIIWTVPPWRLHVPHITVKTEGKKKRADKFDCATYFIEHIV